MGVLRLREGTASTPARDEVLGMFVREQRTASSVNVFGSDSKSAVSDPERTSSVSRWSTIRSRGRAPTTLRSNRCVAESMTGKFDLHYSSRFAVELRFPGL